MELSTRILFPLHRLEIKKIHSARRTQAFVLGPYFISAKVVLYSTFTTLALVGGSMTPYRVFITIGLFQANRLSTTLFVPFAIQHIAEMKVVLQRLKVSAQPDFQVCTQKFSNRFPSRASKSYETNPFSCTPGNLLQECSSFHCLDDLVVWLRNPTDQRDKLPLSG